MTEPTLPPAIEALRDAVNRGDTDGFLALFPEDGVVEDWGRRFAGPAAIRGWSDKELIGARGTLTFARVLSVTPQRVEVVAEWKSNLFSGPGKFVFVLEGRQVREMQISES